MALKHAPVLLLQCLACAWWPGSTLHDAARATHAGRRNQFVTALAQHAEGDMDVDDEAGAAEAAPPAASAPANRVGGLTLADLVAARFPGKAIEEAKHMQPCVMEVLHALQDMMPHGHGQLCLVDTHATCSLRDPTARPDCTAFASPVQVWSQVVTHFEFKLSDADRHVMVGQLVQRSAGTHAIANCRVACWGASA